MWYTFIMKKNKFNFDYNLLANSAIFIILGITPLFFNYFYPLSIDLSKLVLFRIFTFILLFAVAWNLIKNKFVVISSSFKKIWPIIFLFGYLIISLPFSVDVFSSWFGSYNRQEGLSSWLFYLLWATLLVLHLQANKDRELNLINNFLKVASWSGLIAAVYALDQIFGIDFVSWSEPAKITGRAISFLGQPNYFACWLVLILPFSFYLITISSKKNGKIFWSLVFVTQFLGLLVTGSRAVFLIFLAASLGMLIGFLIKEKKIASSKILIILILSFLLTSLFASFLFITNRNRLTEVTDFKKGSLAVRFNLWQTGGEAFLKKPLLGYGLENQKEAYVSYYQTDFALYAKPNTYSDRAHNLIIDTLLTSGILGLIFFSYFLYWVFRNLFNGWHNPEYRRLAIFLLWSLMVYLLSLLFNFSVTITNIYFWFIVALSVIVSDIPILKFKNEQNNLDLSKIVILIAFVLVFLYGTFRELKKIEADYYYQKTLTAIVSRDYFMALVFKDYLDGTRPNPVFLDYYNQSIALRFLEFWPQINDKPTIFIIKQYLLDFNKKFSTDNFENQFVKAFIMGAVGKRYESEELFSKLALVSPKLPKIYLAWGDSLMFNRDYKKAKIKFEQTLNLLPDQQNPYLFGDQKQYLNIYYEQVKNRWQQAELLAK